MKILVTGGAGFVGSHLCKQLLKRGDTVVAIDNFNDYYSPIRKRANVAPILEDSKFTLVEADFCDAVLLDKVFEENKFDAVAHLGAMANVRYSVKNPQIFMRVNVEGTTNLLESSAKYKIKNFIFASTSSVYGQRSNVPFFESDSSDLPLAPYPASKKAGELLGHAYNNMHGLNFTALRFFNVYGPSGRPDMMPYIVIESLLQNKEITLFDAGEMYRDWTYIDDIIAGLIAAIDKPLGYKILNLGRGEPQSMSDFIQILEKLVGKKAIIKNTKAPQSEPKITFANIDSTKELLNYKPQTSLENGLSHFWSWYQSEILA